MRRLTFLVAAVIVAACDGTPAGSSPSSSSASEPPAVTSLPSASVGALPTSPISTAEPAMPSTSAPVPTDTATEPTPYVPPCPGGDAGPAGYKFFTAVTVAVDALKVRDGPCLAGHLVALFGQSNPIRKGTLLMILTSPVVTFDGYRWYAVGIDLGPGTNPTAGWVAAGTTSDSWLRPATLSCPEPTLVGIAGLSPLGRLVCYGTRSLTFTAHQAATPPDVGFGGACDAQEGQPAWLWCWIINYNIVNADGGLASGAGSLKLFFDPTTGIKPLGLAAVGTTGPAYQIRGHFDDSAAAFCPEAFAVDQVAWYEAEIICKSEFVVEALQRIP